MNASRTSAPISNASGPIDSRVEIVFTDLGMPGVSGWDIARETRAKCPDACIVLVTGWGVQIDAESAKERGVDYLLGKPFTVEDVEATLRKIRTRVAPSLRAA